MIVVHVWTDDGQYLGQVHQHGFKLGVDIEDDSHRERVTTALTSYASEGNDFIDLRLGSDRRALEFPSPAWLAVASLMTLPGQDYRVHVIMDARESA